MACAAGPYLAFVKTWYKLYYARSNTAHEWGVEGDLEKFIRRARICDAEVTGEILIAQYAQQLAVHLLLGERRRILREPQLGQPALEKQESAE